MPDSTQTQDFQTQDFQTQDFRKMRVDQVGSLAPPLKLHAAFRRFKNAEISREDLTPFQDDAIREVIQAQEAIGFPIITDGEFHQASFLGSVSLLASPRSVHR